MISNQQQLLDYYCSNSMSELKKISYPLFIKFGGISQKDYDDFYSKANETVWRATEDYDEEKSETFESFLKGCLARKFKTEMTRRNRQKQIPIGELVYLDAAVNEGLALGEKTASNFEIDNELLEKSDFSFDKNVEKYFCNLSKKQRRIVEMKMNDDTVSEIKEMLNLTDKQYENYCNDIKSFNKTQILFSKESFCENQGEEEELVKKITHTVEKSKTKSYSVMSIIKKIENYTIRFDHSLQRESEQWSPVMKGNLISDILQGNPIPPLVFAEQIIDGMSIVWDLDGKQRCTNVYSFSKDGYKITKNIRRWLISYQTIMRDNKGKPDLNSNGIPKNEWREYDIRGKKYSEMPEELQEKFSDYVFEVTQYLNCSSEDIAYHIARYNEGKPMTVSQKGLTRLGEEFASMVKSISNMEFFKDKGDYKLSEFRNGTINRVVVESVMAINFLQDWKKKQEDMCQFIYENATTKHFHNFEDMVSKLTEVITDENSGLFNSKDSFIWFGLFAKFRNTGLDDQRFVEFLAEFKQSLHIKKIKGVSFDDMSEKSTKDKNTVIKKTELLESLMNEYLDIDTEKVITEFVIENEEVKQYIEDFGNSDFGQVLHFKDKIDKVRISIQALMIISGVQDLSDKAIQDYIANEVSVANNIDDVLLYLDVLNDWSLSVDNKFSIFFEQNVLALLGVIAHAYKKEYEDKACIEWLSKYIKEKKVGKRVNDKIIEKYKVMVRGLDKFIT